MIPDYRDLLIEDFAAADVSQRHVIATLAHLLADLTVENLILHELCAREFILRVHGDATLRRLQARRK